MNQEILIRRLNKVIIPKGTNPTENKKQLVATLLYNIQDLGYTLSRKAVNQLSSLTKNEIKDFYEDLIHDLRKLKGTHVQHKPMYPNFPEQVMGMREAELYINAITHYFGDWIGMRIIPKYETEERAKYIGKEKMTVLTVSDENDFKEICNQILSAKTSISQTDKDDLEACFKKYNLTTIKDILPQDIPLKENVGFLAQLLQRYKTSFDVMNKYVRTPTDILRVAVALSDGDISLSKPTKFKSFSNRVRRWIMESLNNIPYAVNEMANYREEWKRLGERIHPGQYHSRYSHAVKAFKMIRNGEGDTYNSQVEKALYSDKMHLISLLMDRPGVFARRLDEVLRLYPDDYETILTAFFQVSTRISTPVLLQLMSHIKNRSMKHRVVFPKGNVAKMQVIKGHGEDFPAKIKKRILSICEGGLYENFVQYEQLGNVFVDPVLKQYTIPFGLRSASKALKTVGRGSRISLGDGKDTVRFFIYWKQPATSRVDLDLSASFYRDNFEYGNVISYYSLRGDEGCHSGDITSAPDGASEFIDINMKKALENGYRYIVMSVRSYTNQPFKDLPECFAGFMLRDKPQSGEIYEPKSIINKIDVTSDSKTVLPLIIDMKERVVIWADIAETANKRNVNNVNSNLETTQILMKSIVEMEKPNLYDLFTLHGEARGKLVKTKEEADIVFDVDNAFNTTEIISKYF